MIVKFKPALLEAKTDKSIVREYGSQYPWFGADATYVGRVMDKTINLKNDTTFDSWAPSTSYGTIKAASVDNDFSQVVDFENSWWFVFHQYYEVALKQGASKITTIKRFSGYVYDIYYPFPGTKSALENGINDQMTSQHIIQGGIRFYDASGVLNYYPGVVYGPALASNGVTLSRTGDNISGKLSAIRARCGFPYFDASKKAQVDSENTNVKITVDVYKTPLSFASALINDIRSDLTQGLD